MKGIVGWSAELAERYRTAGLWEGITVGEMFERSARRAPDKLALVHGDARLDYAELMARCEDRAARLAGIGLRRGERVVMQLPSTVDFVVSLFVMLYLLFFLLRDGDALAKRIKDAVPLRADQKHALFGKFATVIRATVKGDILVAVLQGTLGGIIFWVLGIYAPVLWAVVMAFLSLLPAVGTASVWLPVAIYLLATGSVWQGVVLIGYGMLVISLVDNFLRPFLVGRDTKMPDYVVLTSTLGGIAIFGLNGFIIGPVIAAMFIAVWEIFSASRQSMPKRPTRE